MDKYDRAMVRHKQKKRNRRITILVFVCCIALGYVLGNLSCLVVILYLGG